MKKKLKRWLLTSSTMLFALHLYAQINVSDTAYQTTSIRGRVTNEMQVPLSGVSVTVKGSLLGVVTDTEGNYIITSAPMHSVLIFSSIGYNSEEIRVTTQTEVNVTLKESAAELGGVVVIAYGTQRKGQILSSIGTIKAEDLARSTSPTTSGALVGKVAGLSNRQTQGTPGASTAIQIRNMGAPLFVIDGIVKDEGNFNNINYNDIESISIIKDGAAAIYGVRAANGVVLVKTKQGQKGKISIGLNHYHGWQSWTRFPEMANAAEYVRADYERRINSGEQINVENAKTELAKWEMGYYNPKTGEDYRGYNWTSFARDNVPMDFYNVTASGGGKDVRYYASMAHLDQDAVFKDYKFKRSNFQSNIDAQITNTLKMGINLSGRIETRENPGLGGDDDYYNARLALYRVRPTDRPYANDNPLYPAYLPYDKELNLATMSNDIAGTYADTWRVFDSNWDLEWQSPLKGLIAKYIYSYYYSDNTRNNFERAYDLYTYDYVNEEYVVAGRKETSYVQRQFLGIQRINHQFTLNYDNRFGDHHVSGLFAAERTDINSTNTRITQSPVDNNFLPILTNNGDNIERLEDGYEKRSTAGFALRGTYDYKGTYLVELSGRYDGSSAFPARNRWGFFPSVAAGWRIIEEPFFKNSAFGKAFTNFKIRASFGQTGDDNLGGGYQFLDYLDGYSFAANYAGNAVISKDPWSDVEGVYVRGSRLRATRKDQLSWIKSNMYNVGLDLGFLNSRLTSEIDFFKRKRTRLYAVNTKANEMPEETGIAVPGINKNSDENLGVDGFVRWADRTQHFSYSVGVNAGYSRRKNNLVYGQTFNNSWDEYRYNQNNRWANIAGGNVTWATKIIGQFQSQEEIDNYPVVMDEQGNRTVLPGDFIYADINGDGVINDFDVRPLGYGEALPIFTYGINLAFKWKGIDFAADFAGADMQTLVLDWEAKWPFNAGGNSPKYMINDRWHHEDIFDPTSPWVAGNRPALRLDSWAEGGSYRRWNSYFMQNIDYIRLKNLEIGYSLPKAWTQRLSIERLRLYAAGTNLLTFDNMKKFGLDPEQGARGGLDYPQHRVYTIGLNLHF